MGPVKRLSIFVFLLFFNFIPTAFAVTLSSGLEGTHSGNRPWTVLNALARQQTARIQQQRRIGTLSSAQPAASVDVGNVAVIDDDGTIVVQPNPFDLIGRAVRFT